MTPLSCALPNRRAGGPKASGYDALRITPGTLLYSICGGSDASEQYFCNYGVNENYVARFEASGLVVSARGLGGEVRGVELAANSFFVATLFQPQLSSMPGAPHPLWLAFLTAADRFRERGAQADLGRAGSGRRSALESVPSSSAHRPE